MNLTFGCIIIKRNQILLVKEENKKHPQLTKWNLLSGTIEGGSTFSLEDHIHKEVYEESGLKVEIKGVVALYESITPLDRSLYIVFGCKYKKGKIKVSDPDVLDCKFFDLDKFWEMELDQIVHKDMKRVTRDLLSKKCIDPVRILEYK